MADEITASLLREGGVQGGPRGGWIIPPALQAQRDAEARQIIARESMPNGGGAVPTSSVIPGSNATPGAQSTDPVTAALLNEAKAAPAGPRGLEMPASGNLSDLIPGHKPQPTYKEPSLLKKVAGSPEAALSVASSVVATPLAMGNMIFGAPFDSKRTPDQRFRDTMESLTYQPRSEGGQAVLDSFSKAMDASKLAGMGPTEGMALAGASAIKGAPKAKAQPVGTPQAIQPGIASVGAAAADPATQARAAVAGASPELQSAVEAVLKQKKGQINLEALGRRVEADTLPVPIHLTPGQATGDVVKISNEMNKRGRVPEYAELYNTQNKQLIENTNRIREAAAPDIFVSSKPEIGNIAIDAYRAKDAALNKDIGAKYQALRDANGGQFPLDAKAFVNSADAALHKELLFDHLSPEIRRTIDRAATNGMTFENFEALRTNLARIQRSPTADGNAKAAAGVVRQALEDMPLPKSAEHLKPLADAARSAAKDRFSLIERDPAYKAVVTGKASADKFIDRYIASADAKSVQTLAANLAGNDEALQALRAGVVNRLKDAANIVNDSGNFSQAGYNKAFAAIRPKLDAIFSPQEIKQLEALGNVARYTQQQGRGSFVNNSNTFTAAIGERAKTGAETLGNMIMPYANLGTTTRGALERGAARRELREMLKPGAGL